MAKSKLKEFDVQFEVILNVEMKVKAENEDEAESLIRDMGFSDYDQYIQDCEISDVLFADDSRED